MVVVVVMVVVLDVIRAPVGLLVSVPSLCVCMLLYVYAHCVFVYDVCKCMCVFVQRAEKLIAEHAERYSSQHFFLYLAYQV